jgi:hypothetical protein
MTVTCRVCVYLMQTIRVMGGVVEKESAGVSWKHAYLLVRLHC